MELLTTILIFGGVFASGELIAHFMVFRCLNKRFLAQEDSQEDREDNPESRAQTKGHFERFFLMLGFVSGVNQVVIAFAALKVGTFIFQGDKEDSSSLKISKDYYLIGNVTSISLAM